jgi:hypothetical protein
MRKEVMGRVGIGSGKTRPAGPLTDDWKYLGRGSRQFVRCTSRRTSLVTRRHERLQGVIE